jgi:hypothetical protein
MGRMVLTVLGTVAEMELGLSVIDSAPALTPRKRRAFARAVTLPEAFYGDANNLRG